MSTSMHRTVSPFLLLLALALPAAAEEVTPTPAPPAPPAQVAADGRFTMEFRGARLGQVLDYLSKQAGYVIANPVELAQPITLVALTPLTPAEAVDALNGVLIGQGHAAIVRGRTLHIVPLPSARQQNLPVEFGADPRRIPETDRMVTQIIPVSFATVKDLAENLTPLLNPATGTLAANESSNTLILTDTQANIRRIAAIVQAIDASVSGEQQVRVFNLAYADATTVAQVITDLYTSKASTSRNNQNQGGPFAQMFGGRNGPQQQTAQTSSGSASAKAGEVSAAADSGTNSVVVRASAPTMTVLAEVVAKLDVDTSTRDGVLVYRVRNSKAADLAESLTSLFSGTTTTTTTRTTAQNRTVPGANQAPTAQASGSSSSSSLDLSGQVKVVAEANSNSVLVLTAERNHERIRAILADLDQPVRQVLVRVLIAEVTIEKGLDVGIQLEGVNPSGSDTLSRVFSNFDIFDSTLGMNGYLLESTDFRAAIRALSSDTRFDVLSRPYILTTDNQEATVNVSQNVPVINGSRTDTDNNVTTTFDRQDVGIILTVTPQINSDGRVVLDVNQVMSALADATIPIAEDVDAPIINQRTMTTRVVVEHGQTAVVGGLIKDSLTETVRKVPILGDIPILGWLFKRTERTKAQTELLVFLTPQVVGTPAELADLSRQLRSEMQHLDAAVEAGLLQRHLDQLAGLPVGEPITAPATAPAQE